MQKLRINNHWTRGKDPLLIPYAYILSGSSVLPPTTRSILSEIQTHVFKNVGGK